MIVIIKVNHWNLYVYTIIIQNLQKKTNNREENYYKSATLSLTWLQK